jgi:hypothetical protein
MGYHAMAFTKAEKAGGRKITIDIDDLDHCFFSLIDVMMKQKELCKFYKKLYKVSAFFPYESKGDDTTLEILITWSEE